MRANLSAANHPRRTAREFNVSNFFLPRKESSPRGACDCATKERSIVEVYPTVPHLRLRLRQEDGRRVCRPASIRPLPLTVMKVVCL